MTNLKTNLKILGAMVIAASALSSSAALGQAALSNPDLCQDEFANCTGLGPGGYTGGPRYRQTARRTVYRQPAAGVVVGAAGAAAGTAAAVATAPFRGWGNSYAMYGDEYAWHGDWNTYATRNGIVCRPGTYFKGADGLRHLCQ